MAGTLFFMPKQIALDNGAVVPGAKLHFTQTGTSTDQDTYTDIDLLVAHANPVVADSNGEFDPIYFDPAFSPYRVELTDANDVQIWIEDDIPASPAGQNLTLKDTAPFLDLIETDAATNNGTWRLQANSNQLLLQLANDALSSFATIAAFDRTANVGDSLIFTVTAFTINTIDLTPETGSFTATWTGFTTSPTTTFNYHRIGKIVVIHADGTLVATSNATTLQSGTDVPTSIRPTETTVGGMWEIEDNGTHQVGRLNVLSSGVIQLFAAPGNTAFTNSGDKGFVGSQTFTYLLD